MRLPPPPMDKGGVPEPTLRRTPSTTSTSTSTSSPSPAPSSYDYAILPPNAPPVVKKNTISIQSPNKIHSVVEEERRRNFQALVRRCGGAPLDLSCTSVANHGSATADT